MTPRSPAAPSVKTYAGPAWDNSAEYPGVASPELTADLARARQLTGELRVVSSGVGPLVATAATLAGPSAAAAAQLAQAAYRLQAQAVVLLRNVGTFLTCELSVDGKNAEAKALQSQVQAAEAELGQAYNPVDQLLRLAGDDLVEVFLATPETAPLRFGLAQDRKLRDFTLSLPEEDLLIGLAVNGPTAWGDLYDSLSGSINFVLDLPEGSRRVGLAEAASLSQDEREDVRRSAYRGVQQGWAAHEDAVGGILNALAGWRLDLYKRRSRTRPLHFLDEPLHKSRISRATLDAMHAAVQEAAPLGRQVLKLQAEVLGKERLSPWDLFAPCPTRAGSGWQTPTFDEAVGIVADAYAAVHPDMGAFVRMMAEKRWIEGRVGVAKRPGAYCTKFVKTRSPRVYMTYAGGMRELKTLAHELGHAFHSWVMRDMPLPETAYPMTLAETASIFGETVVNNALIDHATTSEGRLSFTWAQARETESLLLNIPARFQFEQALYERRGTSTLSPDELRALMADAWRTWYGDALSEPDPMFWASKLHFSIASLSFYNFPYTFGYLFALGVYAQRERLGPKFYDAYVSLLRDTGRMTAEEVAAKHLGADLTSPVFWRQSLAIAGRSVRQFEDSVRATRPGATP